MNWRSGFLAVSLAGMAVCSASAHWVWTHPTPTGNVMNSAVILGEQDVVFGGTGGTVMEWDGAAFELSHPNWEVDIQAMAEVPEKGLVAVGTGGRIMTFSGGGWSMDSVPVSATVTCIDGCSCGHAFAGTRSHDILHWDGSHWSAYELPLYMEEQITAVWADSSVNAYAVSSTGAIFHWNGAAWTPHSQVYSSIPKDLRGTGTGELFLAGLGIYRFDGSEWEEISPDGEHWFELLNVLPSGNLMAVQRNGSLFSWDGVSWVQLLDQELGDLSGAAVRSESDVYLATTTGDIYHWTGDTPVRLHPENILTRSLLYDTWTISRDDAYAVGADSTVLHWDGEEWRQVTLPVTDASFRSVWAADSDHVYIGGCFTADNSCVVLFGHGDSWEELPELPMTGLHDIWGVSAESLLVTGWYGETYHWSGTGWSAAFTMPYDLGDDPLIWGVSADDFYLLVTDTYGGPGNPGFSRDLYHWNGTSIDAVAGIENASGTGIWGTASDNLYIGLENAIYRYDGTSLKQVFYSSDLGIVHAIFGFDENTIFAVGDSNIFSWDGHCWRRRQETCGNWLFGLGGADHNYLYAVGANGTILHGNGQVDLGVEIALPERVSPGRDFYVMGYLNNPGDTLEDIQV